MEINNLNYFVDYISTLTDKEEIKRNVIRYGDIRCKYAIQRAWDKATTFFRGVEAFKKKRLKKFVLDYDEENACISLREFNKFFLGIEDELRIHCKYGDKAHREAASDLSATMYNYLGDIRVDHRLLFKKEEGE